MSVIDRSSPMPLWAQVLDDLRRRLDTDEFTDGFPTDVELTQQYGVSRHTAREAVRRLQDEGVVSRERGRGTFVMAPTIEQATGAIYSLFRSIEARGLEQRSEVLELAEVTDAGAAAHLELGADAPLVRLERLRLADGAVLAHDTAWLPASMARPLLDVDFGHTALYDELQARCGVRPTTGTESISTELPDPAERGLLGIAAKQPVFRIRRSSLAGDRLIEWRETVVRGDRYTFVAQWSPARTYETVLTAT
ncbi:MAG: GntR family transcriptional regulator [Acidimicrobiales bacterium]